MKKKYIVAVVIIILLCIVLFSQGFVWRCGNIKTISRMSMKDTQEVAELISDGTWNTEGTADCANDCVLMIRGRKFYYHSDCGTVNDKLMNRSMSKISKSEVNEILEKYIEIGPEERAR